MCMNIHSSYIHIVTGAKEERDGIERNNANTCNLVHAYCVTIAIFNSGLSSIIFLSDSYKLR
jgi:hypothetical protein